MTVNAQAKVVWGSSLVSYANGSVSAGLDLSVSVLNGKDAPYLRANQGSGLSRSSLSSRPDIYVYRGSPNRSRVLRAFYGSVLKTPTTIMNEWNVIFDDSQLLYGDVLSFTTRKHTGGANFAGDNTWVSRNDVLVRETRNHDLAYYELTRFGYHLLRINQFTQKKDQKVSLNTTIAEMNEMIDTFFTIPTGLEDLQNYRIEFDSVDTDTIGRKTSTITLFEKLASGGEFWTTHEVSYIVQPKIEETSYDLMGNVLEETTLTEFNFGSEFTPTPETFLTHEDVLYLYQGWLEDDQIPGVDEPNKGFPPSTSTSKQYHYIYDKSDNYINVTIPTKMLFRTVKKTREIGSNAYQVKNNSDQIHTQVSITGFDEVESSVKLLSSWEEAPTSEEESAKLNLLVDDLEKIKGLNNEVEQQRLFTLAPNSESFLSFSGKYYGQEMGATKVEYTMKLRFESVLS